MYRYGFFIFPQIGTCVANIQAMFYDCLLSFIPYFYVRVRYDPYPDPKPSDADKESGKIMLELGRKKNRWSTGIGDQRELKQKKRKRNLGCNERAMIMNVRNRNCREQILKDKVTKC
jgi:hypothetical protein